MSHLLEKVQQFKEEIDPELSHLDLSDFIDAVALTPREKKQAKEFLKKLKKYK